MSVLLEVAVDTTEGLAEAIRGGADRIELCSALGLGGLTPSVGFMQHAARLGVPAFAMIRPRAGDFVWSAKDIAVMEVDIAAARSTGLQGVVLGASRPDGTLDADVLRQLIVHASGMGLTLHRCFDLVPDQVEALNLAIELGFHRVLTSGGAVKAPQGAAQLAKLIAQAKGRIIVMPGAGVNAASLAALRLQGLQEVHASCSALTTASGPAVDFGFQPGIAQRTDAALVRDLRAALASRPDRA